MLTIICTYTSLDLIYFTLCFTDTWPTFYFKIFIWMWQHTSHSISVMILLTKDVFETVPCYGNKWTT